MRNQVERGIYRDEDPKCSQVDMKCWILSGATPIRTCIKMSVLSFSPCMTFATSSYGVKKRVCGHRGVSRASPRDPVGGQE